MKQGQDVLENPPRKLESSFELAAARIADAWLDTRHISTTTADYRMAREFLEASGWVVEPRPGLTVRVLRGHTFSEEISREEMVAIALRLVLRQVTEQARATPLPADRNSAAA